MEYFHNGYGNAMDRGYNPTPSQNYVGTGIVRIRDLGQSIIDGSRGGRFQRSIQAAIRAGAGRLELNPQPEQGFGVETYGKEEREELRAIAKINQVDLHGVHAPPQLVGDITGKTENGFSEQKRFENVDEIKKHIDFAADVLNGGHVVVHTGEFPRAIAKADWSKGQFEAYPGESKEAVYYLVDAHTGRYNMAVREDEKVFLPQYETDEKGNKIIKLDQNNEPIFKEVFFKDYKEEALKQNPKLNQYDVAKKFLQELEQGEIERIKGNQAHFQQLFMESKLRFDGVKKQIDALKKQDAPTEAVKQKEQEMDYLVKGMKYYEDAVVGVGKQIKDHEEKMKRTISVEEYGKRKAFDSLSELGVYAMQVEKDKRPSRHIYMAPENVFPQMGYGAHPDEIIEFVQGARKEMVKKLTQQQINDPITNQSVKNPNYVPGMSEKEAQKYAEQHIKSTFDTQHLGMWYKHFTPKPGESETDRVKRFNGWYMEQVQKMEKAGVIGNIHIVDGFGRGHQHLVPGEGTFPVVEAVEYLKKKGFAGHMISEAFESQGRQLTGAWEAFGSPIYQAHGGRAPPRFSDLQSSYFGRANPMPYVFGAYSPSEDWTLWSGVPLE